VTEGAPPGAPPRRLRAAVFASGGGSNFQALLDAEVDEAGVAPWQTVLLISDRDSAGAIQRAGRAGIDSRVIPVQGRALDDLSSETVEVLDAARIDVIFLAGYLRLVPPGVVARWSRRVLNVHPALLPAFGGKGMWGRHVHEAVISSGARVTGVTVHFVDEAYDEGRILAQWPVPVLHGDTPERLAGRVLEAEHRLYPLAAAHLCRALLDGREPTSLDPPAPHFVSAAHPIHLDPPPPDP
jgi:formyltetrahydrofolate-dependent phosphoribosylglycinamide formyltransferase